MLRIPEFAVIKSIIQNTQATEQYDNRNPYRITMKLDHMR